MLGVLSEKTSSSSPLGFTKLFLKYWHCAKACMKCELPRPSLQSEPSSVELSFTLTSNLKEDRPNISKKITTFSIRAPL